METSEVQVENVHGECTLQGSFPAGHCHDCAVFAVPTGDRAHVRGGCAGGVARERAGDGRDCAQGGGSAHCCVACGDPRARQTQPGAHQLETKPRRIEMETEETLKTLDEEREAFQKLQVELDKLKQK